MVHEQPHSDVLERSVHAPSEQIDAFICYSRKDRESALILREGLVGHGRTVWMDDRAIRPTEEWPQAVDAGIEAANNFVFLLSPDSVTSEQCRRELEHACRHHKRLVPVLCRPIDPGSVPPALARIHWIEADDGAATLQALLEALDADPDEVRAHTRLLMRALEWDRKGREPSLLMQGTDLRSAEEWLARVHPSSLQPTTLQSQYVAAGRRRAAGRQRALLAATACGLAIAAGLALLYWTERNQASAQARLALARQLAAQANTATAGRLDRALLLAVEANRLSDAVDVRGSLLDALRESSHARRFLHGHKDGVGSLAFSPNGRLLVSGSEDKTIRFWEPVRGRAMGSPLLTEHDVTSVAFSPDGGHLAFGQSMAVTLWDILARRPRFKSLEGHESEVLSVAFAPNGRLLASGGLDNRVILWDAVHGKYLTDIPSLGTTSVRSVAFGPDSDLVASAGDGEAPVAIPLWSTASRKEIGRLPGHGDVRQIVFSPDGRWLASGSYDQTAMLWDIKRLRPASLPLTGHAGTIFGVAFSHDGKTLATASYDQTIALWDSQTGKRLGDSLVGHGDRVFSVAFSPDGRTLASGDGEGEVLLWDLSIRNPLTRVLRARGIKLTRVRILFFGRQGRVLVASDHDSVVLWDIPTGRPIGKILGDIERISALDIGPDGQLLAAAHGDGKILLWDLGKQKSVRSPVATSSRVDSLAFSPDGQILASGEMDGSVRLWNVATAQPFATLGKHHSMAESLAFSPDGKILASGDVHGEILLWDVSRRRLDPVSGLSQESSVNRLVFAADGEILVSTGSGAVQLWDISARQPRGQPLLAEKSKAPIYDLALSPDGKTLAASSMNATVTLWDMESGERLGRPIPDAGTHLAWSPDGKVLAVSGGPPIFEGTPDDQAGRVHPVTARFQPDQAQEESDAVLLVDVDRESWMRLACGIADRPLSREEWKRYLGDLPYEPACKRPR
jgi:WD40 repeat protein